MLNYQQIVLTGAGSGIGRALLAQLAVFPVQIIAVDLDRAGLETSVALLGSVRATISPFVADVSEATSLEALFEYAGQTMGGIDLFMANAGLAYYEQISEPDWLRIERIYRLNVFSPIYAAIKMKAINPHRPYKVVITASAMSHMALPGYALYASTKAALHRFAEGYRFELEDPSTLTLVYPIATRTNFFSAAARRQIPRPWPVQPPERVAQAILHGIRHNQATIYPSRLFALHLFLERFLPFLRRLVQARENRQFQRWLRR